MEELNENIGKLLRECDEKCTHSSPYVSMLNPRQIKQGMVNYIFTHITSANGMQKNGGSVVGMILMANEMLEAYLCKFPV